MAIFLNRVVNLGYFTCNPWAPIATIIKAGIVPIVNAPIAKAASNGVLALAEAMSAETTRPHGINPSMIPSKYLFGALISFESCFVNRLIHLNGSATCNRAAQGKIESKEGKAVTINTIAAVSKSGTDIKIFASENKNAIFINAFSATAIKI